MPKEKMEGEFNSRRQGFFDNIRIVLTALVIMHHAASGYGGAGGWYWREQASGSNQTLVAFNAINQSFFMGCFFLIAGYFTVSSLARRGAGAFLRERFTRLGLPLVVYFFLISPFTNALAATARGESFWTAFIAMFVSAQLEPGPLWFVQSLLLFSVCYVGWVTFFSYRHIVDALPSVPKLLLAGIVVGLASFTVRLWVPTGQSVLWLQLGYFPFYIFLYIAGCLSYRAKILERITLKQSLPWMVLSTVALLSLPFAMSGILGAGAFEGGFTLNAFYYALWDPAVAFGVILGMLWLFRAVFNSGGKTSQFLARRAYAVYIIHPPVLVAVGILLTDWVAHPVAKTVVLGLVAWVACIALASVLLRFAPLRRVI